MKETNISLSDIALILLLVSAVGAGTYLLLRRRQVPKKEPPTSDNRIDKILNMVTEMIETFKADSLSFYLYDQVQRNSIVSDELEEIFSTNGQLKQRPIFKATELSDLGSDYYKIDQIISDYLDNVNYHEHPDLLPIDRLELMVYGNAEENAKKILSKFM